MKNSGFELLNCDKLLHTLNGDYAFVTKLMKIYLVNSEAKIATLEEMIKSNDWDQIRKIVHYLKGSVVTLSECQLFTNLKLLEDFASARNTDSFHQLYHDVQRQFIIFANEIKVFLNEYSKEIDE